MQSGTPRKRKSQYNLPVVTYTNLIPGALRPEPDSVAFRYEVAMALAEKEKSSTLVSPNRPGRRISDGYHGRPRSSAPVTPCNLSSSYSMGELHKSEREEVIPSKTTDMNADMDIDRDNEIVTLEEKME